MQPLPEDWESWDADRLEVEVRRHNAAYWDHNTPEIADPDYDRLVERLRSLRPESAVLQALGPADAERAGNAIVHQNPMLSLDKAYDEASLHKWAAKFEGALVMTPKVDGVACSIRYAADGTLAVAATRGSGAVGEDITANVRRIADVPARLATDRAVEVRGEVYLPLSRFAQLGGQFANPRNTCAGALKQKDADRSAAMGLRFFCYDVIGPEFASEIEKFAWAAAHGFTPVEHELLERDGVQAGYERYVARRASLDFEIDGVVFKANALAEQVRLGATSHHPRHAIAYKLQGDSAPTVLRAVEWSVSRNGVLTPVGIVEPVSLSGATVTRISLANWGLVQSKNLSLGAEVVAMRRGGVIPYLEVVTTPGHTPVVPPSTCPAGGGCTPRIDGDFVRCGVLEGGTGCGAQRVGALAHYAKATGIEGFGEVWLEKLVSEGLLGNPADFYRLNRDVLVTFERMGETLAQKLLDQIEAARDLPLATFLTALGVPGLGRTAGRTLARRFRTLDAVLTATAAEVAALPKFAELLAETVTRGLAAQADLIAALRSLGVRARDDDGAPEAPAAGPLTGQSFLFTGTLVSMKREAAQARVVALGGSAASGVSRGLSWLVVGDAGKAGSKLQKAEQLAVPVLTEAAFAEMLAAAEAQAAEAAEAVEEAEAAEDADAALEAQAVEASTEAQVVEASTEAQVVEASTEASTEAQVAEAITEASAQPQKAAEKSTTTTGQLPLLS